MTISALFNEEGFFVLMYVGFYIYIYTCVIVYML